MFAILFFAVDHPAGAKGNLLAQPQSAMMGVTIHADVLSARRIPFLETFLARSVSA